MSFDNPAHTWLPGAKIAYNNKTKQSQRLISWRNSEDPAPGLFSLELDVTSSSYIILWNNSERYWTSGSWNGQIFSLVPEMRYNYIYNFSYVTNENESYFTYSLYDPSTISRFVMELSGQIQQLTWLETTKLWNLFWAQPRSQCEVYAYCGAYGICNQQSLPFCNCLKGFQPTSDNNWNLSDYSGGCKRKTSLQCGNASLANGKRDKFLEMPNMKVPLQAQSVAVGSSSECESTCLNNCACTAYAYDKGCSIWIGDLLNLRQLTSDDSSGGTLYLKLAASELPSSRNNKAITAGVIAGSVAGITVLVGLIAFFVFRRRKGGIGTAKAVEGSLVAFGYGMMLFELVSGRRNSEQSADGKTSFFPTWAASLIAQGGDVLSLVDPRLGGNADVEEVTRICRLACWCIQDDETHRPPMGQVVQILEGVLDVNLAPVPRSLQVFVDNQEHIVFFTESSSSQSSQVPSNNSNVSSQSKSSISSTSSKS
ncbi:G-type lectin S-receptor-like serine/threonine-protein kinase At2g19130 [Fagus crenata]